MTTLALPHLLRRLEPPYVTVIKGALYALAIVLYLHRLSSDAGIVAAVIAGLAAMGAARVAHHRRLRSLVALVLGLPLLWGAVALGSGVLGWQWISATAGVEGALAVSDVVTFGLLALVTVFTLRLLAHRVRVASLLEVAFVTGAVAVMLADHRHRMINRPRFLSDWAWSMGIDPTQVLVALGAAIALLSALMFLRQQRLLKLLTTVLMLAMIGVLYFTFAGNRIDSSMSTDALGLSGEGQKRRGDGKGGSERPSDNPFKDNYDNSVPPQPVAVAILRDDMPQGGSVIYFRQRVLSAYNGVHLTASRRWDKDVIVTLPTSGDALAESEQHDDAHTRLPTTMYLLVDHPQPPALVHAQRIRLVDNPNPQQFVAAYEVQSRVLAVAPLRLLGRHSIPRKWSAERRKHFLALPDDPRYRTMADRLVRSMDPRFTDDDLARAFTIKRHLEKEGFYTRRSTHASSKDPTASFLFGNLRGYCVHFAHAAVYLLRSQGIAARVALGYAVQTGKRTGGSTLLIMSDRAHAWPEIHLEGVGWVTFDIYPERTDMPLVAAVDYDLERMLGELARASPTAGVRPHRPTLTIPWLLIGVCTAVLAVTLVVLGFVIKLVRQLAPRVRRRGRHRARLAYMAVLDRFSEVGLARRRGETRERHATRLARVAPHLPELTAAHLGYALGSVRAVPIEQFEQLVTRVQQEFRQNTKRARRLVGLLDPVSWARTR